MSFLTIRVFSAIDILIHHQNDSLIVLAEVLVNKIINPRRRQSARCK